MNADVQIADSLARPTLAEAYTSLAKPERKTYRAALGGLLCDGMDNSLYALIIPSLVAAWGISRAEAGGVQTATLLASAIGGWLGGVLADRIGRVRVLQLSILWFSVFSLAAALAQDLTQFTVLRALYGVGFGAEMGVSIALVGEIAQQRHRATLLGVMHSMFSVGAAVAAIVAGALLTLVSEQMGWRWIMAFGAMPALLVLYMRRGVEEPQSYRDARNGTERRASPLAIFTPARLGYTLVGSMISWGTLAGVAGVQTWLPTYLRTVRHMSILSTTSNVVLYQVSHFAGYIVGGYIADRMGRRASFVISSLCSLASVLGYTMLPFNDVGALALTVAMGFFTATIYGGMGALFNELFPASIRGSGVAFCYNAGRGLAAFAPALIGLFSHSLSLATSIGVFAGAAYGIVTIAAFLVPETKGRAL